MKPIQLNSEPSIIHVSTYNEKTPAKSVFHGELESGSYVVLSLEDTQLTLPHEQLDILFNLDDANNLSTFTRIIQGHGAAIDVFSVEGFGTRFDVYFPVTSKTHTADSTETDINTLSGNGESILVVTGTDDQRQLLTAILKPLNYNVDFCRHGPKAVQTADNHHFDLVIIDIEGAYSYRTLLELQKHPEQKIVVLTSSEEGISEAELNNYGVLRKPFMRSEFARTIKMTLD